MILLYNHSLFQQALQVLRKIRQVLQQALQQALQALHSKHRVVQITLMKFKISHSKTEVQGENAL